MFRSAKRSAVKDWNAEAEKVERAILDKTIADVGDNIFMGRIGASGIDPQAGAQALTRYYEKINRPVGVVGYALRALFGPTVA